MENFSKEIVMTIMEDYYEDDKKLTFDMLLFLYHTTTSDELKLEILTVFNKHNICIECGEEMVEYMFKDEDGEDCTVYDCPICGDLEER